MKESINLLPQSQRERVAFLPNPDKISPLVVMALLGAEILFVSLLIFRIKLDADVSRLRTSLEQKKAALERMAGAEEIIHGAQKKLLTIRDIRQSRLSFLGAMSYIPTLIPQDVALVNIVVEPKIVQILAKTPSGISFAKMVENMSHSAKFSELTLTGSSFDDFGQLYTFNFEARVSPGLFEP